MTVAGKHHKAIVLLVAHALYGSALSLARLIFEAYVQGVWLHRCATDADFAQLKRNRLKKKVETYMRDIRQLDDFGQTVLAKVMKPEVWGALNGYTHTGYLQITARRTASTLEPNYTEAEIEGVLNFANAVGLMAALELAVVSGSTELVRPILDKVELFGQEFPAPPQSE